MMIECICSSKHPVTFADDEETVLLHYGRPGLTGAITEEKIFEFDRCSCGGDDSVTALSHRWWLQPHLIYRGFIGF